MNQARLSPSGPIIAASGATIYTVKIAFDGTNHTFSDLEKLGGAGTVALGPEGKSLNVACGRCIPLVQGVITAPEGSFPGGIGLYNMRSPRSTLMTYGFSGTDRTSYFTGVTTGIVEDEAVTWESGTIESGTLTLIFLPVNQ